MCENRNRDAADDVHTSAGCGNRTPSVTHRRREKVDNPVTRTPSVPSHTTRSRRAGAGGASPLAATLRARVRELLALFVAGTLLTLAALRVLGVDLAGAALAAHAPDATVHLHRVPLTYRLVELEAAAAVGLLPAAVAAALYAARDHPRVALRAGRGAFLAAGAAGLAGAALGHAVGVDAVRGLVAAGLAVDGAGGTYWLTELAVTLPFVCGAASALPFALAGAARARLVPRRWTGRRRGVAAAAALSVAAVYSPPDSLTFVAAAGLLLAGLCAGFAVLEFDLA